MMIFPRLPDPPRDFSFTISFTIHLVSLNSSFYQLTIIGIVNKVAMQQSHSAAKKVEIIHLGQSLFRVTDCGGVDSHDLVIQYL